MRETLVVVYKNSHPKTLLQTRKKRFEFPMWGAQVVGDPGLILVSGLQQGCVFRLVLPLGKDQGAQIWAGSCAEPWRRWTSVLSECCHCHLAGPLAAPLGCSGWTVSSNPQLQQCVPLLEAGGWLPQPFSLCRALLAPLPRIPESPALSSKAPPLTRAGGKESPQGSAQNRSW